MTPTLDRCPTPLPANRFHNREQNCDRLSCPFCVTKKREQYKNTVRYWLSKFAAETDQEVVFSSLIEIKNWKMIFAQISRMEARHIRVHTGGAQAFLICTHEIIRPELVDRKKLTVKEAVEQLWALIDKWEKVTVRGFSTSHQWPLCQPPFWFWSQERKEWIRSAQPVKRYFHTPEFAE